MKTQIEIWNGHGWNHHPALSALKSLKAGSRGLASRQGIARIEISPRDAERPYGIAARYFDADGELLFTQAFDEHDSARWIRERVHALLVEGVKERIAARETKMYREYFLKKISAWRRNFDETGPVSGSFEKLAAKFHALRRNAASADLKPSRKLCTNSARGVCGGQISYREALAKIIGAGGVQK